MAGVRRVLVTGGAGFIGSHLAHALLADGWAVDVADDLSTGNAANVPAAVELLELDLGRSADVARLPDRGYAAIAHLAGQSSGEKSFDDPVRDLDANARSTVLLARWALDHDVPVLVQASSMGVYGQPQALPVAEDVPPHPLSWYGASKLAAEHALAVAGRDGVRTASLRMFSIYGPGQDLGELRQGMVSIYLAMLLRSEPVVVKGPLERVRDLVHVDDCVAAWRLALEREVTGAINLGSGTGTSVRELLDVLISALGLPADHPIVEADRTPGDQTALVADTARARDVLGWTAKIGMREGLETMVRWARGA